MDFEENYHWIESLSLCDYQNDLLILAGDVTDTIPLLEQTLAILKQRFGEVCFVPGNHDLWVLRNNLTHSLEKLQLIKNIAANRGIRMEPLSLPGCTIIPLLGWYDYSFGRPGPEMYAMWNDFITCKWPNDMDESNITNHFIAMNQQAVQLHRNSNHVIISFSHFLPRIDIMPPYIPLVHRALYPVFGTTLLERQIRELGSNLHIYGHSHVNNQVKINNTLYLNNAFGYPHERDIADKALKCVFEI